MSEQDLERSDPNVSSHPLSTREDNLSISLTQTLSLTMRNAWQPIPLPCPEVDPELPNLSMIERAAEVMRYKLLQIEYTLSPEGGLRGWLKLNVLLSLLIGIPALFLVPIITYLGSSFVSWTGFLLESLTNILYCLLVLIAIGVTILGVGLLTNYFRREKIRNAQRDNQRF
jgi:hypothetical protein